MSWDLTNFWINVDYQTTANINIEYVESSLEYQRANASIQKSFNDLNVIGETHSTICLFDSCGPDTAANRW